jgi:TonB family protein
MIAQVASLKTDSRSDARAKFGVGSGRLAQFHVSCYPVRIMRSQFVLTLCFVAGCQGFGQTPVTPPPGQMKDPRAILAAAVPYYDFSDPVLKPFHLKATYQLYDDQGKPAEQGTFEYWWASPKIHRITWTRAGDTYTDWYTAGGKHAFLSSAKGPSFFEYKLASAFLSPLPDAGELDPNKFRLDREEVKLGDVKLPCVMVIPKKPQHGQLQEVPLGLFPTYCFDPNVPALRVSYSFGSLAEGFDAIVKLQGRFLPKEIHFAERKRTVLDATVESIDGLTASDPAFTPEPHATYPGVEKVQIPAAMMAGNLVKQVRPLYPAEAKKARVSGTVVLGATIGRDGRIHELHVIEAPWPSLAASALWAVSQWQYKPYLLNGEPVEVDTTINVIYTIGN